MSETPEIYHAEAILAALGKPPEERGEDAPPAAGEFPVEALPEPLRSMAENAALLTGAPVSLCAAAGLAVASSSIGSGLEIQSSPSRTTPANLFILAVAESGTGKGEALRHMAAPFFIEAHRLASEWRDETRPDLLADLDAARTDLEAAKHARKKARDPEAQATSMEAIREATRRVQNAEHDLTCEPVLSLDNFTSEAICEAMSTAPGEAMAVISGEARDTIDILLGRYSRDGKGSDEAIYLKGYSGDPIHSKRKGRPAITLERPRLALFIAFQPDIWQRLAKDARMVESGFLPRCLTFDAKARPARPSEYIIPEAVKGHWSHLVEQLLLYRTGTPIERHVVCPEPAAQAALDAFAIEAAVAREADGKWYSLVPFAARLAENAWRVALTLHAIRNGRQAPGAALTEETANAAVSLTRWFFQETQALLAPVSAKRRECRLERLLDVFKMKRLKALPFWMLKDHHGFGDSELSELAAAFPAHLRIEALPAGPKGGRPPKILHIAPFEDNT